MKLPSSQVAAVTSVRSGCEWSGAGCFTVQRVLPEKELVSKHHYSVFSEKANALLD